MKALVYRGPGMRSWEEVPDARIEEPTDAIVRVDAVTIGGTDLHILKGDVPETEPGRILGHEAVGTVEAVGAAVRTVQPGDRVLVSCISACGRCRYCRVGSYGQCRGGGGWILGHLIDGTQAEYVRTPFAERSLQAAGHGQRRGRAHARRHHADRLRGRRPQWPVRPGDTVAIVGAGPIGLAAIKGARLFIPAHIVAIDLAKTRLDAAGTSAPTPRSWPTMCRNASWSRSPMGWAPTSSSRPSAFPRPSSCAPSSCGPAATSPTSVFTASRPPYIWKTLWIKNVTITTGLVDTYSTPTLLKMVAAGRIDASQFITHRFGIGEMLEAYDVFGQAADTGALKVLLTASR